MADTSSQKSSPASQSVEDQEPPNVGEDDGLARLIFAKRTPPGVGDYILLDPFEFPTDRNRPEYDRVESAVWRVVKKTDAEVHALGCAKESEDRSQGRDRAYRGFRSSTPRIIKAKPTGRGHTFTVIQFPKEGDWHLHIKVVLANGLTKLSPGDKSDVRALMDIAFSPIQPHACDQAA
jgi:hypothetical protein